MRALHLSAEAEKDLTEIAQYTERTWGIGQKQIYLAALRERLAQVRATPGQGAPRDELGVGYRSVRSGSHLIFYLPTADAVEVVRILHSRTDLRRHLPPR